MKLQYRNDKNAKFIASCYNQPLDQPEWYKINAVSEDEAEIYIMSYIGWPYNSADEFIKNLASMTNKKITIRINSPGGDVWDANAIHNAIKRHPSKPTTCVESLAASAASYIAIAGYKKVAYKNAMIMIHEPMTGMYGNQFELRETADILQQVSDGMIDMYADHTNVGKRELREMLKAETWMNVKTAKEKGFIDDIIEESNKTKASFDLSVFYNLPDEFKIENLNEHALTRKELERALRNAGASRSEAKMAASVIAATRSNRTVEDQRNVDLAPGSDDHDNAEIETETINALKSLVINTTAILQS